LFYLSAVLKVTGWSASILKKKAEMSTGKVVGAK
jgi:hypothetical protein